MIKYIGLVVCAILLLTACKKKQESTAPIEEKITASVYASGIVKSKKQYEVFSTVNGLIAELLVTEGDMVKKGDPLFKLTNTAAQLNTENAGIAAAFNTQSANAEKMRELGIAIEQAKIKLDNDALLQQRQRNLWAQQIGTKNDLDQRELAYKTSLNSYEAAKLRYAELQKQIGFQEKQSRKNLEISKTVASDYTIKSNADGKVYNILKEKGEMVNTQTAVALVGDAAAFTLELQIDEYDITRVKPGQKIVISMDSYKGQVFDAVVEKINPTMNERSKSFTVDAVFIQQPTALYPNLTCEANIIIETKDKALTIPRNYLMEGDFVLLKSNEKKKVTTGLKDYEKVEILSGLTTSDIIIKPVL